MLLLLQQAVASPEVQAVTKDLNPASYLIQFLTTNMGVVWAIQLAKKSKHPALAWLTGGWTARAVAAIAASLSAVGMSMAWTTTDGVGTLMITGITLTAVLSLVQDVAQNYLTQFGIYKTVFGWPARDTPPPPEVREDPAILKQIEERKAAMAEYQRRMEQEIKDLENLTLGKGGGSPKE